MQSIINKIDFALPFIPELYHKLKSDYLIFSMILGLEKAGKKCYAGNTYFSELLGCSDSTVEKTIKKLVDKKFIIRKGSRNNRILTVNYDFLSVILAEKIEAEAENITVNTKNEEINKEINKIKAPVQKSIPPQNSQQNSVLEYFIEKIKEKNWNIDANQLAFRFLNKFSDEIKKPYWKKIADKYIEKTAKNMGYPTFYRSSHSNQSYSSLNQIMQTMNLGLGS